MGTRWSRGRGGREGHPPNSHSPRPLSPLSRHCASVLIGPVFLVDAQPAACESGLEPLFRQTANALGVTLSDRAASREYGQAGMTTQS